MHAEQVVADMVDEVLARQAAVRARWSGESLGEALHAVVRTEAGGSYRSCVTGHKAPRERTSGKRIWFVPERRREAP